MPVNEDISRDVFKTAPPSNTHPQQRQVSPSPLFVAPEPGAVLLAVEVAPARESGAPPHRKPGAAKRPAPENSTSRTDAAHLS
jgi:hypothetical protein